MKLITLAITISLFSFGCNSNNLYKEQVNTEISIPNTITESELANKASYNVTFKLEKSEDIQYNLVVNMELFDGTYFLAPSSDIMFRGRFDISLNKTESIILDSNYFEYPLPTLESDPFGNGPIMVQRVNTTYKKKIIIDTAEDFEVTGLVKFTIEPKCTLEMIEYTISSKSGELMVIKK